MGSFFKRIFGTETEIVHPSSSCEVDVITDCCLAPVKVGGNWGYIDKTSKVIINPQFYLAWAFSEGLACVFDDNKFGFIDKTGKLVIKPQFYSLGSFSEGLAAVKIGGYDNGKMGFIDKTGNFVINPQFDWAGGFSEGLAAVKIGDKCGYIDDFGKIVIIPQFDRAWEFHEGLAPICIGYYLNGGKWGFIDKTGRASIKQVFDGATWFSEGWAAVKIGDKWGYIDKLGKFVINPQFDEARQFHDGLACVRIGDYENGKYGFIDKTGHYVINPQFDMAYSFSEGLACVKDHRRYGYIDKTGMWFIKPQFHEASSFVKIDTDSSVKRKVYENSNNSPYFLFFDTETTGLSIDYKLPSSCTSNWPRLVQLSWIVTDRLCNVIKQEDYIIYPDNFRIPIDAANVHGITTEKARKNGVRIETVINSFLEDFNKCNTIVGHNIDFDKKILGAELVRMGLTDVIESKPTICTMKKSTSFCKIPNSNGLGYKWPKLQELHKKLFGREFNDAHNSMADVQATLDCFKELIIRGLV